ncbi:MAG: T9SS type A sorting domain-containing protein [Williamsia sp.]|nr:T9SS type A sorting domain-containing protein [Williamsia sp.]
MAEHLPFTDDAWMRDTVPAVDTFDFYVSNQGSNANSGKSPASPKLTIDNISRLINEYAVSNSKASLGLQAGSNFREQFNISSNSILTSSFSMLSEDKKAQFTGMDVVTDWRATTGKTNTYESSITHVVDFASNNYNCLLVAEIDTMMEKSYPVSAVRYLRFVSTLDLCESTPGSFFMGFVNQNPAPVYIHATQGIPGKNKFRYEVVKRPYNIFGFYANNSTFENLFLRSAGNGVGMLAGGENTTVRNVTFQGGGTHHAVIYSGRVDKSLFLPGPDGLPDEIGLVFYKPEGMRARNVLTNTLFLDIRNAAFTHTNGTSDYSSLRVDSAYAFADTLNTNAMLSSTNTDSVIISNNYCYGYKSFWLGIPHYLSIQNATINNVSEAAIHLGSDLDIECNATVSNTLITTNCNDANKGSPSFQPSVGFRFAQKSTTLKVANTVFYGRSTWHTQYATETVFENSLNNRLQAFNNIYICDVNPENYMHVVNANNGTGKGTASNLVSDYNVYVLLRGTIYWTSYPTSPQGDANIFTLQDWQAFSGQDKHSIFIDLRNNPAGLKAIFTDPENGNWTLAQTPQADSVRMLNAGMLTPPLYYPLRPVYEDALDHNLPGGLSYFTGNRDTSHQVKLDWKTIREPNFAYFGIESSTNKIDFARIANVKTLGSNNDNSYTSIFSDTASTRVFYRLRMVNSDSSSILSAVAYVDPSKKDSIINGIGTNTIGIILYPNPGQTSINIEHPAREHAEISVYDFMGRLLNRVQVAQRSLKTVLPVNELAAGKYIIRWRSEREEKAVSFVRSGQ